MWWLWGMLACQSMSDKTTSPTAETAVFSPTASDTSTTTDTEEPVDICAVPVVEPTGPLVTFTTPPKRVVVLSIDTLRRDFVDFYNCDGDGVGRMPFLSKLLAESVSFEDVQQCSNWTFPSTNCTLSGTLLTEMDHVPRGGPGGRPVPDGQRTLATLLSDEGFFTGGVFSNGWFTRISDPSLPVEDQMTGNSQGYQEVVGNGGGALSVSQFAVDMMKVARANDADLDRWLLHLHFIEPHDLYNAPESFIPELPTLPVIPVDFTNRNSFRAAQQVYASLSPKQQAAYLENFHYRYTGDLRLLDSRLVTVWEQLESEGLLEDTLVVIWTDHGEAFWERGPQAHGYRLGAEENDAILAFWHPDLEPKRVTGPHHAIDFLPTTFAALGFDVPSDLQGVLAGDVQADRVRYSSSPNIAGFRFQSVTKEGFKLSAGWDGSVSLHDRNVDPKERKDLFASDHPRVPELWSLLEPRIQMLEKRIPDGQRVDWKALNANFKTK